MGHSAQSHSGDSGLAFGLTVATAAAFALGAILPFFYNTTNGVFLSNALSFSAGVMLFVSLVEIYGKSYDGFAESYCPDGGDEICASAFGAALGVFLAGCVICVILQALNNRKMYKKYHAWATGTKVVEEGQLHVDLPPGWQAGFDRASRRPFYFHLASRKTSWAFPGEEASTHVTGTHVTSETPSAESQPSQVVTQPTAPPMPTGVQYLGAPGILPVSTVTYPLQQYPVVGSAFGGKMEEEGEGSPPCPKTEDEQAEMLASGIVTAIAIAIHNFPEGFVTFMATYQDSSVGAAIAFAIAMHNLPEGVCVGAPVYYSTNSKWKTIAAGLFGGIWAPIGGLVAWAAFGKDEDLSGTAYGWMFGLVCGIMTYLSLNELMPLAYRYSQCKWQNDVCMVLGMVVMGLSILLFEV